MSNRQITKNAINKEGEYQLVKGPFPYHAREDATLLDPNNLITPSKNVINNFGHRLQLVKGYTLDGQANTTTTLGPELITNGTFTGGTAGWTLQTL